MAHVVVVHRWDGSPAADWYPWLKKTLEKQNVKVTVIKMPHPDAPSIDDWVAAVVKAVPVPDAQTFFVGHSVGCQTIMRYLEKLPSSAKVAGVVFVGGWFILSPESTSDPESLRIAKPWLETKIDVVKVKSHGAKFTAVFSDDDPFVPLTNAKTFAQELGAQIVFESGLGHFTEGDDVRELPVVVEELVRLGL